MSERGIAVVIVVYHPSEADILQIEKLDAAYRGVLVDNTPNGRSRAADMSLANLHYIYNGNHNGIAGAQNRALEWLLRQDGIERVVFLDQDSRVDTSYPRLISNEFGRISKFYHLALLGPTTYHEQDGTEYKSVIHTKPKAQQGFIARRDVISSGSCCSIGVLQELGLFDEKLFIDYVDFELCWRAESQGWLCGITTRACIRHQVGCREIKLGSYRVIISAPYRYYYQYRNYLWLCRRHYVPLQWKVATSIKHLSRLFYLPIVLKHGTKYLSFMLKGIVSGLTRKNEYQQNDKSKCDSCFI
mgnify:CR=1 FL=1